MDLSQGEVGCVHGGRKVVPSDAPIVWDERSVAQTLWHGPVEVEAVQVGLVTLYLNPQFERRWTFKLSLHGSDVYRVDVKAPPLRHSNPSGRPDGLPRQGHFTRA